MSQESHEGLTQRILELEGRQDELTEAETRLRMELAKARQAKTRSNKKLRELGELYLERTRLLEEAREQLALLREEIEKLTSPPNPFGVVLNINKDGTVDIFTGGRKLRVEVNPLIDMATLTIGEEVILNETHNVIEIRGVADTGEVVAIQEMLDNGRVIVMEHLGDERVITLADSMRDISLRAGDHARIDPKSALILEKIERPEVEELVLEEIPNVAYEDIGGLVRQIEQIRDAVELPYLHRDLFGEYELEAPKGVLLYGPPGCGKTLIAKAIATSLAEAARESTGNEDVRSYFLNIKGPELLNKWVGETERKIRLIFQRAKEKAQEGIPVIIFFDEMDALFRTRGSGISSDVESTIVPQLLSEIDGVEGLKNVIVIGASNREDRIDPAVLRPGRLDVKIKIERPDASAARQIFRVYLDTDLPLDKRELDEYGTPQRLVDAMVEKAVEMMYSTEKANEFIEVTYAGGDRETFYYKDFSSGAMIKNVVRRAKKSAVKREIAFGESGLRIDDLVAAVMQEFKEQEDMPNTANPDDWAKISGKKGEKIIHVRVLLDYGESRAVEGITPGQYL